MEMWGAVDFIRAFRQSLLAGDSFDASYAVDFQSSLVGLTFHGNGVSQASQWPHQSALKSLKWFPTRGPRLKRL